MRVVRTGVIWAVLAVGLAAAPAASGSPAADSPQQVAPAASMAELPCTPVHVWWPGASTARTDLQPPQLAILVTDLRPKDAVVLLDGRVAGRSRYFNGTKGSLYLEPGRYTLEVRLDGYRPEAFSVDARPGCRYELRHRMERDRGAVDDDTLAGIGKGEPVQQIWQPAGAETAPERPPAPRADLELRPDLESGSRAPAGEKPELGSLRLHIEPGTASVFLDGTLLATARELELMVAPLAIPAGRHTLEVRAPGHATRAHEVVIVAGVIVEMTIQLDPADSSEGVGEFLKKSFRSSLQPPDDTV